MAKQKNRASRKLGRERASRAEERGLPQAKPPSIRDTQRLATSSALHRRSAEAASSGGAGTMLRVALGVVVALIIVFLVSQNRKDDMLEPRELPSDSKLMAE